MPWFSSQWVTPFVVLMLVTACLVAEPLIDSPTLEEHGWAMPPDSPHSARRNSLEAAQKQTAHRLEVKMRLLEELVAGRLTLAEVSGYFSELNAEAPLYEELIRLNVRGHTAEERSARNVLEHLRGVPMNPTQREAVFARLHREFHDRFGYSVD